MISISFQEIFSSFHSPVEFAVFSECELVFIFAIGRRLSSVTFVHPTKAIEI